MQLGEAFGVQHTRTYLGGQKTAACLFPNTRAPVVQVNSKSCLLLISYLQHLQWPAVGNMEYTDTNHVSLQTTLHGTLISKRKQNLWKGNVCILSNFKSFLNYSGFMQWIPSSWTGMLQSDDTRCTWINTYLWNI